MRYILMLEHDDDDRYITKQTFDDQNAHLDVRFVTSSDELFDFLGSCLKKTAELPSLILLNYYSFPINSVEILKSIKTSEPFGHIPVIVLSGTVSNEIVFESYRAGCSTFIQKPALSADTNKKIASFVDYWFKTATLV